MKLIQCPNNHYYDSDKFASCPYCAQVGAAANVTIPLGHPAAENSPGAFDTETMTTVMPDVPPQTPAPDNYSIPTAPQITPDSFRSPEPAPAPAAAWPSSEDAKTVSYFAKNIGIEPVVGWLVAIGGKYFGEDFRLKSGRNFIGRSPEMDIQLSLDITVSRRKHAIIVYEPKSRMFIAQPGDSRELFYLNDKVVLNSTELKDRDVLTIGETKLMLVTLCNSSFSWEDHAGDN